jgi:SAM-dependent methyltransferase
MSLILALDRRVTCNVCGWSGCRFVSDSWHVGVICPWCRSHVRHRLLWASVSDIDRVVGTDVFEGRSILHFGAESALAHHLARRASKYITADLHVKAACRLDMSSMPSIPDEQYDTVVACDVLEHVDDDVAALAELRRILRPGGWALLTVPQTESPLEAYEDPTVVGPAQRQLLFGQADHVRIYGRAFPRRLERAGFRVVPVDASHFTPEAVRKHVLAPPVPSPDPRATNHRTIFFAQKADRQV